MLCLRFILDSTLAPPGGSRVHISYESLTLVQEDESLQRWKASLGLNTAGGNGLPKKVCSVAWPPLASPQFTDADNAQVVPKTLFLTSPTRQGDVIIDLTNAAAESARLKKDPGG